MCVWGAVGSSQGRMKFAVKHIVFVINGHQVYVGQDPLPLSARGHACLKLFLQSENQVLSKDFLLKSLWQDVIVSDDSLFKVIQEVRKVLRDLNLADDVLTNVYGQGYQFNAKVAEVSGRRRLMHAIVAVLVAALLLWWWMKQPATTTISDQQFAQYIKQIETQYNAQPVDLTTLGVGEHSPPTDQLKLGYLQGLLAYKGGDYDGSIRSLLKAVNAYQNRPSVKVLADAYLLLSKMYIYRADKAALKTYLDAAQMHYVAIGDEAGLVATQISRARYHQVMLEYPKSIVLLREVLSQAERHNDRYNQMRAHSNLAYSFQQTGQHAEYVQALEDTLELALQIADGTYAAYAYGALSEVYLQQADHIKAMKYAQLALQFVLEQPDTNIFQQGFSAFYNVLHDVGHVALAEQYLTQAIAVQAHFNDESLLVQAEINLARVKTSLGQHEAAQVILKKLLATELSEQESHEVTAWYAINAYHRQDNITAYTKAKQVFTWSDVAPKTRFVAGMAVVLSGHELERAAEVIDTFTALQTLQNPDWLIEYEQFVDLAGFYWTDVVPDEAQRQLWSEHKHRHQQKQQTIASETVPANSLMADLDHYLAKILP